MQKEEERVHPRWGCLLPSDRMILLRENGGWGECGALGVLINQATDSSAICSLARSRFYQNGNQQGPSL